MRLNSPNRILSIVTTSVLVLTMLSASVSAQEVYSGRAFGVSVEVLILPDIVLSDTGELPPTGGNLTNSLLDASVSGSVSLGAVTLEVGTSGGAFLASSFAETQGLDLTLTSGLQSASVTADVIRAESQSDCMNASGSTLITNLRIDDEEITITGEPNQVVEIPGIATLVINEQIGGVGEITVNAIHISLLASTVDVIISSAHSGVACLVPVERTAWGDMKKLYMQ